jgi:hypothetical protein
MTQEDKLQSECVKWFRYQYPAFVLFAIPNGGQRNAITGALLKKTGTLAGVADLFLMRGGIGYNGLFIEMKVGKNKQTDTQKEFQKSCWKNNYKYAICRSFDEFMEVVDSYLDVP